LAERNLRRKDQQAVTAITIVLFLLLAVVASSFISRALPVNIPLPLVQIALGALIAFAGVERVALDPEIFFLLFLPPLLFLDGWRIPKVGLFRDKWTILELAFGLVFVTVIGMGFFIHWMIPAIPLAVAFALAAVVSPTDPVAVAAIVKRTPLPKRVMHILEGESLLNDASGLVCLRFAIAAALTGTFSITGAATTFAQLALGGIVIGVLVTLGITMAKTFVARKFGEDSGSQVLISLLIPFAAYMAAEHMHCSGILAAVAAGVTMSYAELSGQALPITRVRRTAVWETLHFSINGVIFVLLGEQLPGIVAEASIAADETGNHELWMLALYVVAITLGLLLLRFIWVWTSVHFTILRKRNNPDQPQIPHWRLIAAMSCAGVRGAITLAGVLSIPLLLNDGTPFPARDLVIFLATGVIILSMLIATLGLPHLVKGLNIPEESHQAEEDKARRSAAEAAIRAIEKAEHDMAEGRVDADMYIDAGARLMEIYRARVSDQALSGVAREQYFRSEEIEHNLRLAALRAERDELYRMARAQEIGDETVRKLVRELDLIEARHTS